tara:strand:- start:88 stop:1134 length:1047 start_codon:yes stop_codon:yes gene_type:complete
MPKIYRNIEQKRFNELDEADRNIWSRVVKDEGKAVEQFDSPIKFQSKFERITAYTLTKLLEDLRNELTGTISEYNSGNTEQGDDAGKIILYWNTAVSYLKNIIMRGSISNKDIEKINSLLDSLKPLVSQVLSIAEEYKFIDLAQIRQLNEKFNGNDWSPITSVLKVQNINDLLQDLPEVLLEDEDINPDDEEKEDFDEVYQKLQNSRAQIREIIDNIPNYGLEQLKDLYRHYMKKQTRNISKSKIILDLSNKMEELFEEVNNTLLEMEARDEEEDDDVFYDALPPAPAPVLPAPVAEEEDEGDFGFAGFFGEGKKKKKKMKMNKVKKLEPAMPFNDLLNDAYLFQGIQ